MNKTICPRCGKNIVGRRYPIEPLAEFMGLSISAACLQVGISGSTQQSARCHGITRNIVDKAGAMLKEHPAVIWPEVVDHDIEDTSRQCDDCPERFVPRQHNQRFCSTRCRERWHHRQWRRRLDPDELERQRAKHRRYREECGDYLRAKDRHYYQQVKDTPEYRRRRLEAERAYKARKRAEDPVGYRAALAAYAREYRARKRAEREVA